MSPEEGGTNGPKAIRKGSPVLNLRKLRRWTKEENKGGYNKPLAGVEKNTRKKKLMVVPRKNARGSVQACVEKKEKKRFKNIASTNEETHAYLDKEEQWKLFLKRAIIKRKSKRKAAKQMKDGSPSGGE